MKCSICGQELEPGETPCPNCSEAADADLDDAEETRGEVTDDALAEDSLGVEDTFMPEALRKAQEKLAKRAPAPAQDTDAEDA